MFAAGALGGCSEEGDRVGGDFEKEWREWASASESHSESGRRLGEMFLGKSPKAWRGRQDVEEALRGLEGLMRILRMEQRCTAVKLILRKAAAAWDSQCAREGAPKLRWGDLWGEVAVNSREVLECFVRGDLLGLGYRKSLALPSVRLCRGFLNRDVPEEAIVHECCDHLESALELLPEEKHRCCSCGEPIDWGDLNEFQSEGLCPSCGEKKRGPSAIDIMLESSVARLAEEEKKNG